MLCCPQLPGGLKEVQQLKKKKCFWLTAREVFVETVAKSMYTSKCDMETVFCCPQGVPRSPNWENKKKNKQMGDYREAHRKDSLERKTGKIHNIKPSVVFELWQGNPKSFLMEIVKIYYLRLMKWKGIENKNGIKVPKICTKCKMTVIFWPWHSRL